MSKPESEEQANRRKWINFGETIAVLALIVSALGLYNSWQDGKTGPTEIVEKKQPVPLVLRGEVVRNGRALHLAPIEDGHALESATLTLANGKTLELGSNGEIDAGDVAEALDPKGERKGEASARVRMTANYVEAGQERSATRAYVLRYRWEGGGLFDDTDLRFTGFSRG